MLMMKRLLSLLLAATMLACALPAMAEEDADAAFDALLKKYKAVGAALVVCRGDDVIYEHYYGYAVKKTKEPVTADTWFRVASVSKMISAIAVMQQVEQGKLALEDDLSDIYGFSFRNARYPDTPITLRMVMSHTSSLSQKNDYNKTSSSLSAGFGPGKRNSLNYERFEPGTKYQYSNMNGGLLGSLVEQTTGMNFNDYMREYVFDPLGVMAAYSPTLLPHTQTTVTQYGKNGSGVYKSREYVLQENWDSTVNPDMHFKKSAFALWTNAGGLAKLGMMLCGGGTLQGVTVLSDDSVAQMLEDQHGKPGILAQPAYGLDVERMATLLEDRLVYGHEGLSSGILANLYFEPQSGLTFAFLCNGCDNTMQNGIAKLSRKLFAVAWEYFGD